MTEICAMPVSEKYLLSIKEAGQYFSVGIKKMRRLGPNKQKALKCAYVSAEA